MFKFWLRSPLFEAAPADGAPGGGGGAGADPTPGFDAAAFKAELLGEFNKTLNGALKGLKNDFSKLVTPPKPADPVVDPVVDPAKPVDPEKNALQLEIKKLREQSEQRIKALEDSKSASEQKAEEMARDGALRDALGKFEFMSPEARNTAMQIFRSAITRADDGSLVAGDLPLEKYIENELPAKHAYLIKGKDIGGANARPGKTGGGKKWDLDRDLKPENFSKFTPAEQNELRQHLAQSL